MPSICQSWCILFQLSPLWVTTRIMPEVLHLIGNIISLLMIFSLFHLLTVDEKRVTVSKTGVVPIIPLVLSPPYHHQVLLWRSSVVLFFLSKNCLAPHRLFFYHRPPCFSQHLCSPLLLVSPNLCEKESCSKSERTLSQIFVQHKRTPAEEMIKESLSPHWVPSGIIEPCHLCNWILLSNFCKEKHVSIEHDDKRLLTKGLLLFKLW